MPKIISKPESTKPASIAKSDKLTKYQFVQIRDADKENITKVLAEHISIKFPRSKRTSDGDFKIGGKTLTIRQTKGGYVQVRLNGLLDQRKALNPVEALMLISGIEKDAALKLIVGESENENDSGEGEKSKKPSIWELLETFIAETDIYVSPHNFTFYTKEGKEIDSANTLFWKSLNKDGKDVNKYLLDLLLARHDRHTHHLIARIETFKVVKSKDLIREYYDLLGAEPDHFEIFKNWLLLYIRMLMNPNGSYPHRWMLVLKGDQQLSKDSWLRNLFQCLGHVKNEVPAEEKERVIAMAQNSLLLVSELGHITSRDFRHYKEAISESGGSARMFHKQTYGYFLRVNAFASTTNNDKFLYEDDAHSRFIILEITKKVSSDTLKKFNVEGLWSQVYKEYLKAVPSKESNGDVLHYTPEQNAVINEMGMSHILKTGKDFQLSTFVLSILKRYDRDSIVQTKVIVDELNQAYKKDLGYFNENIVGSVISKILGCKSKTIKVEGNHLRGWKLGQGTTVPKENSDDLV